MSERGWTDLGPEYEAYLRAGAQRDRRSQPHDRRPRVSVELTDRGLRHTARRQSVTAPAVPRVRRFLFWGFVLIFIGLLISLLIGTFTLPPPWGFASPHPHKSCPEVLPGYEEYCDLVRYMKCQNAGNTECLREFGVMYPPGSSLPAEAAQEPADASSQDHGMPRSRAGSRAHDP